MASPRAVSHPGGCEAGGGSSHLAPLAPLWSGWLHPLPRGPDAAALCHLQLAPGFLGAGVTPLPTSLPYFYLDPHATSIPSSGDFSPHQNH